CHDARDRECGRSYGRGNPGRIEMITHELLARDLSSLIHPQHDPAVHRSGHVWVRGRGAMLVDADGHEYIDGLAGLWNVVLGHGRRELADAARDQMETLAYVSGYSGS